MNTNTEILKQDTKKDENGGLMRLLVLYWAAFLVCYVTMEDLHGLADLVESPLIRLTVLNIPLMLGLAIMSLWLWQWRRRALAYVFATVLSLLVSAHFLLGAAHLIELR